MKEDFYIYILTNKRHTVFYTGMTNDLVRRVFEHKQKQIGGFTKKYNVNQLIYFEKCNNPITAIAREKEIKDWRRDKKLALLQKVNPEMNDLYVGIC